MVKQQKQPSTELNSFEEVLKDISNGKTNISEKHHLEA
jgi:hypothetical protein